MESSLVINSIDTSGNLKQKTVTYVNPAVTNAKLETFAQKMTAMSTNTYVNSKRLDATSPASELSPGESSGGSATAKTVPTLSLGVWTKSGTTYTATISYNGDGTLSSTLGTISGSTLSITDADGIFSGIIMATETDTYAASSLSFTYNTEETSGGSDNRYQPTISNISANFDSSSSILTVSFYATYIPPTGDIDNYPGTIVAVTPLPIVMYSEAAQGVAKIIADEDGADSTAKEFTVTFEIPSDIDSLIQAEYYYIYIVVPETQYTNKAAIAVYDPQQQ